MSDDSLTEHARRNRAAWDGFAAEFVEPGERCWASDDPSWGIWGVPEREVAILPDVRGLDVVELGCGTAYWSAWLARRGARPVGIDNSAVQLETASRLQREHGLEFPLVHGTAEATPFSDASFDLALSEYGASLWCDPDLWIPEAARLLRPGGRLIFLTSSPLLLLCTGPQGPADDRLVRDQFGLRRVEFPDEAPAVEFHLAHGEMIDVLRRSGLSVEVLHELQAPEGADPGRYDFVPPAWARRWPSEEIWRARLAS